MVPPVGAPVGARVASALTGRALLTVGLALAALVLVALLRAADFQSKQLGVTPRADSAVDAEGGHNLYRFGPFAFTSDARRRVHGTNERIGVEPLGDAVRFYIQLIRNSAG